MKSMMLPTCQGTDDTSEELLGYMCILEQSAEYAEDQDYFKDPSFVHISIRM